VPATPLPLTHFPSMAVFALLVSVTLACLARRTALGRIKYGLWSFALFLAIAIGIAWLMYPFSH
jgi:hypothetical protein